MAQFNGGDGGANQFDAGGAAENSTSLSNICAVAFRAHLGGQVSRSTLLTRLIPIAMVSSLGALMVAASYFPGGYNWRTQVISKLTSPFENPEFYLLGSLGIMSALLVALPFGGYVSQRLHRCSPWLALLARRTFTLSLASTLVSMITQLVVTSPRSKVHNFFAYAAVGFFVIGMICCCVCAVKDRLRSPGQKRTFCRSLTVAWISFTLLPVVSIAAILALSILGQVAGLAWAENLRQSFRGTMFWHLAFWEWFAIFMAFTFAIISVVLLPDRIANQREESVKR